MAKRSSWISARFWAARSGAACCWAALSTCAFFLGCAAEALPGSPRATSTSTNGLLHVSAQTIDDEPPARGLNAFDIEIVRSDEGSGLEDREVTVTPWMPAMGHGTSVRPTVRETGAGHYRVDNVYLFMPGLWELRVSVAGFLGDDAAPRFQIP